MVAGEELAGVAHMPLRKLDGLPDEAMAEMVPHWREGLEMEVAQGRLWSRDATGEDPTEVCELDERETLMVLEYDGGRNLATIAGQLARAHGLAEGDAFAETRALFVRLCEEGWCHPAASHEHSAQAGGERTDE